MYDISELTVLVVDGNQDSLHEMCDIVELIGLKRILCAPDAESALAWLVEADGRNIDLILVNHELPHMDGMLFIGKARSLCPTKQIILYSNSKKPTAYMMALNIGATDFIDRDKNFRANVLNKLPFWIEITQRQASIEGAFHDKRKG